uniref:Solute carrier family 5 member 8 n=1 Tax=Tetraodon nigroviridis TaxID=99883 RepID=H3CN89_TETNG
MVVRSLTLEDYAVLVVMLAVSMAIGVYFAWTSRGSAQEFLTGGRKLSIFPVSMSLIASLMSSITVLSNPAEVYCFGAVFACFGVTYITATAIASETFLPVIYRLSITSTYEYLEMRFNRATRLLGTVLFILQTILMTGLVIYGPAVALNQVTGIDLWGGIISTGVVCTVYCTLGGIKAVVWTDVFQIGVMLAGYLAAIIKSVIIQGGVSTIISDSQQGGRLNFFDFDIDPLRRHTFWTITVGGTFTGLSLVQRFISCKTVTQARAALLINVLGLSAFLASSVFAGMCLYSVYKNCDPWTSGQISAPDQLMPYLVMDILSDYAGLPGLFLTAVCSGSLSTVSSSINALAAVTLEDLIKPYFRLSEKHQFWMSKGLCFLFGMLCISMAGFTSFMGGMMQANMMINGIVGGSVLGLFSLGIFCPFANTKVRLNHYFTRFNLNLSDVTGWVLYPPSAAKTRPLSLTADGCNFTSTAGPNWTSTLLPTEPSSTLTPLMLDRNEEDLWDSSWQSPSYLYFGLIGSVTAFIVGVTVSLLTGKESEKPLLKKSFVFNFYLSLFLGGLRNKVESRLMINKEDTFSYHIYMFIKERVGIAAAG